MQNRLLVIHVRNVGIGLMLLLPCLLSADCSYTNEGDGSAKDKTHLACERAKQHLDRKEYHEACSVLEDALKADSSNPELYALLGNAFLGLGDKEAAVVIFNLRGYLYFKRKEWDHAIADYTKAIQIDPDVAESYYNRGSVYRRQGKYAKARTDFEVAYKHGDKSSPYSLAKLLAMCPDPAVRDGRLAVKYAQIAHDRKLDTEATCSALLAAAYAEAGEWDDAVRHCERAIQLNQGPLHEFWCMCLELYRLHEPFHEGPCEASLDFSTSSLWALSRTRNDVDKCVDATKNTSSRRTDKPNPQLADVHLRLGEFLHYSDTVDAILHYSRCIELDPKNPLGFVGRSFAYSILGKSQEAMADAKTALALSPKHVNVRCAYAWCLTSLGQANKAISEVNELHREFSDNPVLHLVRGHCFLAQRHFDKAVGELTEAIEGNSKLTIAYAERAVALSVLGKKDEANRDLDECGRPSVSLREITEARIKALQEGQTRGPEGHSRSR